MLIQEHYATYSGVQLPEIAPTFPVNFYPIPVKYITLSPKTGQPSKNYPHWAEVVRWCQPVLIKNGIHIIQLGEAEEPPIRGCVSKTGLSFRESSFVVQNSLLHLSGDSCFVHFAGMVKTPVLALYGSPLPAATGPYYKGKFEALEARNDLPSYETKESDPQIAYIKPETVVNKIFEMLGLRERVTIKTIKIGSMYYSQQISLIPDFAPDFQKLSKVRLVVRMDIAHNESLVAEVLKNRQRSTLLVCKDQPSKEFLEFCKGKVDRIMQKFGEDYDFEKLEQLKNSGIPYTLIWTGAKEKLGEVRFNLLDFDPVHTTKHEKLEEVTQGCYFKTNQTFLGRGKHYPSLWHYHRGVQGAGGEVGEAIKSEEFWEGSESYFFFQKG